MSWSDAQLLHDSQGVAVGQNFEFAFPLGRVAARRTQLFVNVGGVTHELGDSGSNVSQDLDQNVQPSVLPEKSFNKAIGGGHPLAAQPCSDFWLRISDREIVLLCQGDQRFADDWMTVRMMVAVQVRG